MEAYPRFTGAFRSFSQSEKLGGSGKNAYIAKKRHFMQFQSSCFAGRLRSLNLRFWKNENTASAETERFFFLRVRDFGKTDEDFFWRSRHFEKLKDDEIVENAKTFAKEVRENGLLLLSAQDGQEAERYAHLFRFARFLCESRRPFPQHRQCSGDGTKQELQEFPFGRSSDHEAAREADAPLLLASYNMFCTQDNIALPTKKPSKTESPDVTILFSEL